MASNSIKGVILAGGLGSRLLPCTRVTNKHLLPVYDQPMIHYPIKTLLEAGIDDLLIVTGGHSAGDFLKLIRNGQSFGLKHINYTYQEGEGGIAAALSLAEYFVGDSKMCVMLGDNILEGSIKHAADDFKQQESGAKILLKEVEDAKRFGVVEMKEDKIIKIFEKPENPPSKLAVTGVYFYDSSVFEFIKSLKPSERGELEITDVNNMYLERGDLTHSVLDGWWTDAGTFESLRRATNLVAESRLKEML